MCVCEICDDDRYYQHTLRRCIICRKRVGNCCSATKQVTILAGISLSKEISPLLSDKKTKQKRSKTLVCEFCDGCDSDTYLGGILASAMPDIEDAVTLVMKNISPYRFYPDYIRDENRIFLVGKTTGDGSVSIY